MRVMFPIKYIVEKEKSDRLIDEFKKKFVYPDYDRRNQKVSWLFWCNLSCKGKIIPTIRFKEISVEPDKKVYFYNERERKCYYLSFSKVRDYIIKLEPWEEIDAEIFDDTFDWFIAVTHEDFSIIYGLP